MKPYGKAYFHKRIPIQDELTVWSI